jgi:hypothetical protein
MAKKITETLVSDLSGKDIAEGDGDTIKFGWLGAEYTIDLTNAEVEKFTKVIDPYVSAGTKVARSAGGRKASSNGSGSGRSKSDLADIRAWAKDNGYEVSERGRIKADVLEAYDAAT